MFRSLLLLLLLAGCATVPEEMVHGTDAEAGFAFNGRVVLKQGKQRESAGVRWVHRGEDEILLLAPLGQTLARIRSDEQSATLEASGRKYAAQDMESLMQQVLGWQLPLNGMRYWVAAQPVPDIESEVERDASGRIRLLRQQGWVISYARYTTDTADALPLRLTLKREDMEVVLQIDEWTTQ